MNENKAKQTKENKNGQTVRPSDIQGKIDVIDKRERKDGPGGN